MLQQACGQLFTHAANSNISSPVRLVLDPVTGRSRFEFFEAESHPEGRREHTANITGTPTSPLQASPKNPGKTVKDSVVSTMGGTESRDSSLAVSESEKSTSVAPSPVLSSIKAHLEREGRGGEALPSHLFIRLVGEDAIVEESRKLKSCLKRQRTLSTDGPSGEGSSDLASSSVVPGDSAGSGSPPRTQAGKLGRIEGDGAVDSKDLGSKAGVTAVDDEPTISIVMDSKPAKKSKSKNKKKETGPSADGDATKDCKIRWGDVAVRYYTRLVGGSGGIPEYSGLEWTLGFSDTIVMDTSSGKGSEYTYLDPESDSEGETELIDAGVAAFAAVLKAGPSFSPKMHSKKHGSPKHGKAPLKSQKMPEMAPLELPAPASPSVSGRRRAAISGYSVRLGSVEEVDVLKQKELAARYRTLSDKEKAFVKNEEPLETRQYSHRKIPQEVGGNPLFRPLTDRQRADVYARSGVDTKSTEIAKRNAREARILQAIHTSRSKVGCQCRNLQPAEIRKWTVRRLHLELQSRALDSAGTRQEMVDRLVKYSAAIPTCKDQRMDLSLYEPDVIPGASGPFILDTPDACMRGQKLFDDIAKENLHFFFGNFDESVNGADRTHAASEKAAPAAGTVVTSSGIIGENLCPCASSGIGCIEECRCRKFGCSNRQCHDNTAYAYDGDTVHEIVAEMLARTKKSGNLVFTAEEMQELRSGAFERVSAKIQAQRKAQVAEAETSTAAESDAADMPLESAEQPVDGGCQKQTPDQLSAEEVAADSVNGGALPESPAEQSSELPAMEAISIGTGAPSADELTDVKESKSLTAATDNFQAAFAAKLAEMFATASVSKPTAESEPKKEVPSPRRGRGRGRGRGASFARSAHPTSHTGDELHAPVPEKHSHMGGMGGLDCEARPADASPIVDVVAMNGPEDTSTSHRHHFYRGRGRGRGRGGRMAENLKKT